MKIIKRSGTEVVFDIDKILAAVVKANESVVASEQMTQEQIEALVENRKEDVAKIAGADALGKIREETLKSYSRHARLGNKILENFVQFLKAY